MSTAPRITGTFLDEITHDIPSQNWGPEEWRRELALYPKIGVDTLILIRAGYRNRCVFPARSIPGLMPVYDDLAGMFFELASELELNLYFGLYDSGEHWVHGDWRKEVELNQAFAEEAAERYGGQKSFSGWYFCHEAGRDEGHVVELYNALGAQCKDVKELPVLISPYPEGPKLDTGRPPLGIDQTVSQWDRIFGETRGAIDVCAFQDGQVEYRDLPRLHEGIAELGKRHGVTIWSNVESFDRDMPIKFPPADWRNLRFKLELAANFAEKIVTFEFPHFLSPNSTWPSARNLFQRYCEFAGLPAD